MNLSELLEDELLELPLGQDTEEVVRALLGIYRLERLELLNKAILERYNSGPIYPVEAAGLGVLANTLALLQREGII
jgi:hypothetical protein